MSSDQMKFGGGDDVSHAIVTNSSDRVGLGFEKKHFKFGSGGGFVSGNRARVWPG